MFLPCQTKLAMFIFFVLLGCSESARIKVTKRTTKDKRSPTTSLLKAAVALEHKEGKCSDMEPVESLQCGPITDSESCEAAREILIDEQAQFDFGPSFPDFVDYSAEESEALRNSVPGFCSIKEIGGAQGAWHVKFNGVDKAETAAPPQKKSSTVRIMVLCGCFEQVATVEEKVIAEHNPAIDIIPESITQEVSQLSDEKEIDPLVLKAGSKSGESQELISTVPDTQVEEIVFTKFEALANQDGICSMYKPSGNMQCAPIKDLETCTKAREQLQTEKASTVFGDFADYSGSSPTLRSTAPGFCSVKIIGGNDGVWHMKFNGDDYPETRAKATRKTAHIHYRNICGCWES